MSSVRYKKLLTNLPSMAAIVNSFESTEVQLAVFSTLIQEFDDATQSSSSESPVAVKTAALVQPNGDVAHEVEEGDSIHSLAADGDN